ncbi:MAG: YicC family protein [Cytophagaceae bacterium]|jgi:uncharacterized protein (TIGR00255 family)|nr:YicC family protein [Cytophagaceae bacterium]
MIKSMTGYGVSVSENERLAVSVEIKSLNSKFLDLNLRLPKEYADRELDVRNLLNTAVERGKISLSFDIRQKGEVKPKVSINRELVAFYYQELQQAASMANAKADNLFQTALQLPGALDSEVALNDNDEEWKFIFGVLQEAIKKFDVFRLDEGKTIAQKFSEYLDIIENRLNKVMEFDPIRIQTIKERIRNSLADLQMENVDQGRFEQELIYYIEKLDISEEKLRLKTHLDYFRETMKNKESNGKKLGFIAQEIGREINTIGSKSNDANIQKCVVEMKDELEKIKEQVLNIL